MTSEQDEGLDRYGLEAIQTQSKCETIQQIAKYAAWVIGAYFFFDSAREIVKSSPEQITALCEGLVQFLPSKMVYLAIIALLVFFLVCFIAAYKKLEKRYENCNKQLNIVLYARNPRGQISSN